MPPELEEGQAAAPAPETAEIQAAEAAGAEAAAEVAETAEEGAAGAPEAAGEAAEAEAPQPAATTNQKLVGRIGHLTKTLHQKDEELAAARRRAEAAEALLGQGADGEAPRPVTTADTPAPGTPEFDRLVDERAAQKARVDAFNRDCNTIFDSGIEKHGDAFKEAVTNLNALDLMSPALIEAAMATDSPADVINALGTDVDEAARIAALSPVRMAAEIVKLSGKLSAPKGAGAVSRVPAPITPVGGQVTSTNDVSDPDISMAEYVRRRKAQGSRWAR